MKDGEQIVQTFYVVRNICLYNTTFQTSHLYNWFLLFSILLWSCLVYGLLCSRTSSLVLTLDGGLVCLSIVDKGLYTTATCCYK